jgi:predicted ATPase
MEQPEIHLHPSVQSHLADVFLSAIKATENGEPRNVQLVIESHSEHFLTRLQRRIAEQEVSVDDVAIYFTSQNKNGNARLEPLKMNVFGDIENWPEGFFGDEMEDITARTLAAARRRRELKKQGG